MMKNQEFNTENEMRLSSKGRPSIHNGYLKIPVSRINYISMFNFRKFIDLNYDFSTKVTYTFLLQIHHEEIIRIKHL